MGMKKRMAFWRIWGVFNSMKPGRGFSFRFEAEFGYEDEPTE